MNYSAAKSSHFCSHVAVPLSPLHPPSLLTYYLQDCEASLLITTPDHSSILKEGNIKHMNLLILDESWSTLKEPDSKLNELLAEKNVLENHRNDDGAMILYTSGTTGKPKGVLLTHENLDAQVRMLLKIWKWTGSDVILNALPLHHTHGVVNALLCPLYVGARYVFTLGTIIRIINCLV